MDHDRRPTLRQLAERIGADEAIHRVATKVGERLKECIPEGVGFILVLTDLEGDDRLYVSNQNRAQVADMMSGLLSTLRSRGTVQ